MTMRECARLSAYWRLMNTTGSCTVTPHVRLPGDTLEKERKSAMVPEKYQLLENGWYCPGTDSPPDGIAEESSH